MNICIFPPVNQSISCCCVYVTHVIDNKLVSKVASKNVSLEDSYDSQVRLKSAFLASRGSFQNDFEEKNR